MKEINTYIYSGFIDSGKTTYIEDVIFHDYFHKRGSTLIISFEYGDVDYNEAALLNFNTKVVYYDNRNIKEFCDDVIEKEKPDRIFIEDNSMIDNLMNELPDYLKICAKTSLIDGSTLDLYFLNMKPIFQRILSNANLVIFNRTNNKDDLKKYGNDFRLLNNKTNYLWKSPLGYHEKAFGVMVNYDKNNDHIILNNEDYKDFYLDTLDDIDSYSNKIIEFDGQIKETESKDKVLIGNIVMTCCLADLQFISYECYQNKDKSLKEGMKIHLIGKTKIEIDDKYHTKHLVFIPVE